MAYADLSFYTTKYRTGTKSIIPNSAFNYWERQAELELDRITFNRLRAKLGDMDELVKCCVCEIAEFMYCADQFNGKGLPSGSPGLLASFSNDGESANYDLEVFKAKYTGQGYYENLADIANKYLWSTGLMYRGV